MAKPRPLDGGDSFWLEDNPLANFDPLRETTAQSRALRKGEAFIPFEQRQPPPAVPLSLTPPRTALPPPATAPLELLARANADPELSYMGLKILLAVLTFPPGEPISLSRFSELTGLSKTGVISGIRNSLDAGYVTRAQSCPRCAAPLSYTEDKKTVPCISCRREVPPQARYAVFVEDSPVADKDSPVFRKNRAVFEPDSLPVGTEDSPVLTEDRAVFVKNSSPVTGNDSPPVSVEDSPVIGKDRVGQRAAAFASRIMKGTVTTEDSPVFGSDSPPVADKDRSRARAESVPESKQRINDSRIPPASGSAETGRVVYGSQGWQAMTESLAKDTAKRIGDKSIGFQVKCWAHARKLDWEQGGRRFEDGLLTIAQELEGKHKGSGKSQGALWTKMVRRYFEEKGHPLLTEAEQEEWKELHGTYQPPQI